MIKISNMRVPLGASDADIRKIAARKLGIGPQEVFAVKYLRRSVDARHKNDVHFVLTAAFAVSRNENVIINRRKGRDISLYAPAEIPAVYTKIRRGLRPVICGAGPAGLFAALTLARAGWEPIVLERGAEALTRIEKVKHFNTTRELDPDCNVQFGEGGAGTFSDGKLTTNTHDPRCVKVLEELAAAGAPEEIMWQSKPHIGTDKLPGVVENMRREINRQGGEVRFGAKLTGIILRNGALCAVEINGDTKMAADRLVLAAGHSARDVYELMKRLGAEMERKPFSIGVRVEHPQKLIDAAQYGPSAGNPAIGAADYKLYCHLPNGRTVYTFCMCPGGAVSAAASEPGGVVTNGHSRYSRDGENANSALLCSVNPGDFPGGGMLAGVEFQRTWEKAAFHIGGGDYTAPAQLMADFLRGQPSSGEESVRPTYPMGVKFCDISQCLPGFISDALRRAVPVFDGKLHGFALPDAVLTGVETRSSAPVRILRGADFQSNLRGVYPCGEGAGYAGGIVSSAVDGLRVAEAILREDQNGQKNKAVYT